MSFCECGALADENTAPARFYVDDDQARPISQATSIRFQTQRQPSRPFEARWSEVSQRQIVRRPENWRLQWRESQAIDSRTTNATATVGKSTRQSTIRLAPSAGLHRFEARSNSNVIATQFNTSIQLEEARTQRSEPSVLKAQDIPADPFSDPFGDRDLPMPVERSSDPPAFREVPQSPPASDRNGFRLIVPAAVVQPGAPSQLPLADQTPLFDDGTAPKPPETDHLYNRRNCCEDGRQCDEHRAHVRESPLSTISLNITPRMTVTQLDIKDYEEELQKVMQKMQPRVWRNDAGDTLADGRMTDFKHGRIEVQTEDGLEAIPFADLCDDDMCFVTAWWSIPSECSLGNDPVIDRNWVASTMTWKASSLRHKPLYFEDVNLERYGHSRGPLLQPVMSGAHFFMNVAALPYKMGINPPTECRYPLG